MHNPYTPPKANVSVSAREAGAAIPRARPAAVNIALFLIGVAILLSLIGVVSAVGPVSAGEAPALGLVMGVLKAVIHTVLCVFIARGRNWARIGFLVIWVVALFSVGAWIYTALYLLPEQIGYVPSWESVPWIAIPHALSLTVVILLFGPGREWFRNPAPSPE